MSSQETVLLLGFGDIARRLAGRLKNRYQLVGVRRSAESVDGITLHQADCSDLTQMQPLLAEKADVIVITMTPSEISDVGYQRAYVQTVTTLLDGLSALDWQPRLIVFVSSTSVYGQQQGEWVDESSPTEPTSFGGKRLLEAEQLLLNSDHDVCVVRFSGIYGPGRQRLIEQVLAGNGAAAEPVLFSNRIHGDDAAAVLEHLVEKQKTDTLESIYLATDCEPAPLYEVKNWLAQQLGLPEDHLQPSSPGRMVRSSKRVSNQRLVQSGFQFQYPSFREGYEAVLKTFSI